MCRFKASVWVAIAVVVLVSIHPMCRFKFFTIEKVQGIRSFNTSYVSVQDRPGQRDSKRVFVSIHPMCRFK